MEQRDLVHDLHTLVVPREGTAALESGGVSACEAQGGGGQGLQTGRVVRPEGARIHLFAVSMLVCA